MSSPWLRLFAITCCSIVASAPGAARAELPSFLRRENREVLEGNQKLEKGDAKGALEAYDRAARVLPSAPGVQLNRGLALLSLGELGKAREAWLAASEPSAPAELRADAYRNLALSFYREADTLAGQERHDEAQKLLRESIDASKRALRLRPADPSTAWNLELATRRLREVREQQKQKREQEQQEQQDESQEDSQGQDDQAQGDEQKDQDQPNESPSDENGQNDASSKEDQKPKAKDPAAESKPEGKSADQRPNTPKPEEKRDADKAREQEAQAKESEGAAPKPLPAEAEQALSALQEGEENFERMKARRRAARERRAPEKDW